MDKQLERELDRIHDKLDLMGRKLDGHIDTIARIETRQRGIITILTLFITSAFGAVTKWFA